MLLKEALRNTAFPNGKALYEHMRMWLFWQGLWSDCLQVSLQSLERQKELESFL